MSNLWKDIKENPVGAAGAFEVVVFLAASTMSALGETIHGINNFLPDSGTAENNFQNLDVFDLD